ncbi:MAG: substrate-binding domain-containing protein [Deltaproteobacteria bacterium]
MTDLRTTRDARSNMSVLVILSTGSAWSRGILRGFMAAAHERDWIVLHFHPDADVKCLVQEWAPAAAVIGPELTAQAIEALSPVPLVSVTVDRCAQGVASVCLDEKAIGTLALQHLLDTGLRHFTTFRFDESPFAVAREQAFVRGAGAVGARVTAGWTGEGARPGQRIEDPAAILAWLSQLPTPCGIFTCTDGWGRTVARYVRLAGLRMPEDIALVGADNDMLECELMSPPLSSVVIPWREIGRSAAQIVQLALSGKPIEGKRVVLSPLAVVARRSSQVFAISDPLVAKAVGWIRSNAERRLSVSMVARAVGGGRKRLERRFRAALDRTVHQEIRRAHVDRAKGLLESSGASLVEIAKHSGFTNAALLTDAFHRELGMPPGVYRRRMRQERGLQTIEEPFEPRAQGECSNSPLFAGSLVRATVRLHVPPEAG